MTAQLSPSLCCIPTIEKSMRSPDWNLPGEGEAYASCGAWNYEGCLNKEEHPCGLDGRPAGQVFVRKFKQSCNRRDCPKCYEGWAWLEAEKAAYRLKAYKSGYAKHIVLSCPKNTPIDCDYKVLRKTAYKIARKAGIKGGLMIYHPYRFKPERWSPHFHIVGYGLIKGAATIFKDTGWLVRNLGIRKTLAGTVKYQLSHCGVHKSFHAITWWGELSYNKMKIPKMPDKPKPTCPLCGAVRVPLQYLGDRPPPDKAGEYWLDPEGWFEKHGIFG
jgi:hypothetical protein